MTAEELRVEVARLVGWKHICFPTSVGILYGYPPGIEDFRAVPHYDTDLNAAHEACRALLVTEELVQAFVWNLTRARIISVKTERDLFECNLVFATAAEICQALYNVFNPHP